MKKLFISLSSFISYLFLMPIVAFAQTAATPTPTSKPVSVNICLDQKENLIANLVCNLGQNVALTLRNLVVFFVILAIVIALVYLLYGGLKWITSGGEKEHVEAARKHIVAAVLGLVIVVLAVFILAIALAAFGIRIDQLEIPIITSK